MKKLRFLMLALLIPAFVMTGCGDDGGGEGKPTYTVTFNADGGTPAPAAQKVTEGEKATAPAAVTKTGYTFLHWSKDGAAAYDFATPVTANFTLTAKWEAVAEPEIEIPDESELTQEAFADEETTGGFTFTAKSAWTATVTETTTRANLSGESATRASGVDWLRLLFDGEETYSGAAGKFTLVIELDENYTGETRTATITIKSGNDTITITVTQGGKTEDGEVPVDPDPDPEMKQVASIRVTAKSDDGYSDTWPITFSYDTEGRLSSVADDDDNCTFSYASGKVTMTVALDGEDDRVFTVALNGDGNAEKVTVQGEEYDEMLFAYDKGYIVKAENNHGDNHYFKWQNDNMVKYWLGGDGYEPADDDYSSQLLAYSSYRNNTTEIDLNTLFIEIPQPYFPSYQWYGDVTKWLGFAGLLGKRSTDLTTDFFPVTVAYAGDTYSITNEIAKEPLLYTFDGDYPTVITGKYVIKTWKRYNDGVTELVSTTNYTDIYEISYVK